MQKLREKYEHLRKHNFVTNDKAQTLLRANHYVAIIQATGTGKSYQAYQIIQDMCLEGWCGSSFIKVLIVVPSDPLVSDWDKHLRAQGDFYKNLQSAGMVEAKTARGLVKYNLKDGNKLGYDYEVCTYTNMAKKAGVNSKNASDSLSPEQEQAAVNFMGHFNLVIFDEVHHAGAATYAGVIKKMIERAGGDHYVLGMTATSGRTDGTNVESYFGGSVVHGVTRQQAQDGDYEYYDNHGEIKRGGQEGILPHVKTILSLVYDPSLSSCRALRNFYERWIGELDKKEQNQYMQMLDLIFSNLSVEDYAKFARSKLLPEPFQKLICFYQEGESVVNVKKFLTKVFGISNIVDVHSNYNDKENDNNLDSFKNAEEDIIICAIDKLNEGLHISGVTGIIMIRRTFSPIIFNQQLGRAMDYGNRKKTIPVFDIVGNSAIQADVEDGTPDELQAFIDEMEGTEEFAPNFKEASMMLKRLEAGLISAGAKKPPMASKGDLKKILMQATDGYVLQYTGKMTEFTLEELKRFLSECLARKAKTDLKMAYDISIFPNESVHQFMLYYGWDKYRVIAPCLYYIYENYVEKNGQFRDRDDMISWTIRQYKFKPAAAQSLKGEVIKREYNRFLQMKESITTADEYLSFVESFYKV